MSDRYPKVEIRTRDALRSWLERHHGSSPGAWLVTYKRGDHRYVPRSEIVEELLSFGWVDSVPRAVDDKRTSILVTPRKPNSRWSKVNKEIVERLTRADMMRPQGLAAVRAAHESGTWDALDEVDALVEPADLADALDQSASAREYWETFPRSTKRAILEWILAAKQPTTRAARIRKTVDDAAAGRRANQWRQPERKTP